MTPTRRFINRVLFRQERHQQLAEKSKGDLSPESPLTISDEPTAVLESADLSTTTSSTSSPDTLLTSCTLSVQRNTEGVRHVHFGNVHVREYEQVIGDHPHCCSGCPLALGWNHTKEVVQTLCNHRTSAPQRRRKSLHFTDEQRYDRLLAHGVTQAEIRRSLRFLRREREHSVPCRMSTTVADSEFFRKSKPLEAAV